MKFKDKNNGVHDPEMGEAKGLIFLTERNSILAPFAAITDIEAADFLIPSAEDLEVARISSLKKIRNDALNSLTHDFGDDRIMQTRPQDEVKIRIAIESMTKYSIASRMWSMIDDKKYNVTVFELETAYEAGILGSIQIWDDYNP